MFKLSHLHNYFLFNQIKLVVYTKFIALMLGSHNPCSRAVFTGREHGRVHGCLFLTRVHGPCSRVSKNVTREHGPCSRVPVHTGRVHGP